MNDTQANLFFAISNLTDEYNPIDFDQIQKYIQFKVINTKIDDLAAKDIKEENIRLRTCEDRDFSSSSSLLSGFQATKAFFPSMQCMDDLGIISLKNGTFDFI